MKPFLIEHKQSKELYIVVEKLNGGWLVVHNESSAFDYLSDNNLFEFKFIDFYNGGDSHERKLRSS